MKTLFIGGIKSGKSKNAEKFTIKHAKKMPYYLATTEFIDEEMAKRVKRHKKQRAKNFITVEEPLKLKKAISKLDDMVLVECVSMWINNMLYHGFGYKEIKKEIKAILKQNKNIVFVINEVGSGILSKNKLAREFTDINGKISQLIAKKCDRVFYNIAGIKKKVK